MTDAQLRLGSIFATPFAAGHLGLDARVNEQIAQLCMLLCQSNDADAQSTPLTFLSRENFFSFGDAPVQCLREAFVNAVIRTVAAIAPKTVQQWTGLSADVQARFAVLREGGAVPMIQSKAASWNCVYAVKTAAVSKGRPDSGAVRIYETRPHNMFMDGCNWGFQAPFAHGHHLWRPIAGHLALFPAACAYEVAALRDTETQILIFARVRFVAASSQAGA